MSYKHCVEVKIKVDKNGKNTSSHKNRAQIVQHVLAGVNVSISKKSPTLVKMLNSVGCVVRDGWTGGCYGARDGSSGEGYTVWIDASELPERTIETYLDGSKQEVINPFSLINDFGGVLVENLDGDIFTETCKNLGLKIEQNNSFNYAGHDEISPLFLVDMDYAIIFNENGKNTGAYLAVMFHCGGDIRGNYTDRVVFKFESLDDIWGVVYPVSEIEQDIA